MSRKILTGIIAIAVVIVLLSTILIPMVDDASKTTVDIKGNDNPSWIRMSYHTGKMDDSVQVSQSGSYIVGTQSGSEDVIFYADSSSVIYSDNGRFYLYNDTMNVLLNAPFTLTVSGYVTTVNDGNEYVLPQHSWMYFPDPDGHCTTYHSMDFVSDTPVAALSQKFAGVRAYNGVNGISMTVVKNGETVDDVYWGKKNTAPPQIVPAPAPVPQVIPTPAPQNVPAPQNTPNRSNTDGEYTAEELYNTYQDGDDVFVPANLIIYISEFHGYTATPNDFEIGYYNEYGTVDVQLSYGGTTKTVHFRPNSYEARDLTNSPFTTSNGVKIIKCGPAGTTITITNEHDPSHVATPNQITVSDNQLTTVQITNGSSTTYYAYFTADTDQYIHALAYYPGTGTGTMPMTVIYDDEEYHIQIQPSPNAFSKENYTFYQWRSGSGVPYPEGFKVSVLGDMCIPLTAEWKENRKYDHNIHYNSNGATGGDTPTTTIRDYDPGYIDVPLAECGFTWEGHTFTGWKVGDVIYQPGQTIPVLGATTVDAYAQWVEDTKYTHTVTYNIGTGDGGSTPDTVIEDYNSGSSNVPLAYCGFTKTNHHFIGWIVGSSVYQPGQTVSVPANGTVTATAMWEEDEKYSHTIIYDPGTGTGTMSNTVITDYISGTTDVPLAANGFTKTNWHFVGWLVDGTVHQPGTSIPVAGSGSVTAVAQWEEDTKYTHTITYDGNTATGGSTPDTVLTDYNSGISNVTLSDCGFTKTNWYFVGWSVNGVTYQPGQTVEVEGNQRIVALAMWEENPKYTHTIIYDPGTGTGTMGATVITDYEPNVTYVPLAQNEFTKTNYHFVGWLVDGAVHQYNDPIAVVGGQSVTAVAQWEEDPKYTHTITYEMGTGNGGSTPDTVITDYNNGLTSVILAPNGFTKTNYHFVGWLVDGSVYQPGDSVDVIGNGSLTAVAQWEEDERFSHSISYDKGIIDATGTMNNTVVIDYNSGNSPVTLAPNGFTLTNFHFVGWLVNGTVYNENVAIDVAGNTTVTAVAQWEEDERFVHTITYDGNGATSGSVFNTAVTDYNSGETLLTLAPNGFVKTNWHFIGWSVNGVTYQPGQTIPVLGNQIVTAIALWEEDTRYTHTITYNGNGNTGGSTPDTVVTNYDSGDTMVTFGDCGFTKENWHFVGWKLYNQGPMYQPGQTVAIRGNATVTAYAQWDEDPKYTHTITYDSDGGTGLIQNTVLTDYNPGESDVILAECTYIKQHNTFAGWLVNGVVYNAGDPVKVAGGQTVTAVAVWDKIVYTSGDWSYTVTGSNATIVGYNAAPSGTVTIPGTVDGFPVAMIGDGTPVITTDTADWSVDLRNVKAINDNAFSGCTHLIGAIVLSSDISYIGHHAFSNTGITDVVSYMGNATIEDDAFSDSSVRELLNLGTMEIGNTSFGLNATVQTFLDTSMCIGDHADSYTEVVGKGNVYGVLPMISLILVAGVLIAVSGFILMRKE